MNSLYAQAKKRIPGGVSSPVRAFKHVGGEPIYFASGRGARLVDVDGKDYIDFCLSFGPHLLGHSHPVVVDAIREQAGKATSFGACHPLEPEMAELVLSAVPFLDKVRFVTSGTEAVMTAVRLARGTTGRNKIVVFEGCYHGHSDGLLAKAGSGVAELADASSAGVPPSVVADTLVIRWDDPASWDRVFHEQGDAIAALLLEPIPANCGLLHPERNQLHRLTELARSCGALVIFDEVITGFRIGFSGASGYYDLKPDLVTYGKVLGAGLPLAAVAGTAKVMENLAPQGTVYQAGTLAGNPLGLAAGLAALKILQRDNPYHALGLATTGFVERLRSVLARFGKYQVNAVGSLFWVLFDETVRGFPPEITPEAKSTYGQFFKFAADRGVYFPPSPYEVSFLSTAHTEAELAIALERLGA